MGSIAHVRTLHFASFQFQLNQESSKPKLAPLNEAGVSELLNKVEFKCFHRWKGKFWWCCHIQEQNVSVFPGDSKTTGGERQTEKQTPGFRISGVKSDLLFLKRSHGSCVLHFSNVWQAMSALDEKTKAERALKDLQKMQGEQQVRLQVRFAVTPPTPPPFLFHFHPHLFMFCNMFLIKRSLFICFYLQTRT